jgi:predicted NBD/HSP70 family sugar kinase
MTTPATTHLSTHYLPTTSARRVELRRERALDRFQREQAAVANAIDTAGPDDIVIGGRGDGPVAIDMPSAPRK